MATSRLRPEGRTPFQPTRIMIRKAHEPRDEQARLPKSVHRIRPTSIDVAIGETLPAGTEHHSSQRTSSELADLPHEPEIVDVAASNTWPRRTPGSRRVSSRRIASPSTASEMSLGILDYYLTSSSPPSRSSLAEAAPRIGTPLLDMARDKFEFDFTPPKSPSLLSDGLAVSAGEPIVNDTQAGAEKAGQQLVGSAPLPDHSRLSTERKEKYSLFPNIEISTPTRRSAIDALNPQPTQPKSTSVIGIPSLHHQQYQNQHEKPDPSYRPRKESISSSVQSRKDSFTSFSGTCRIPMRVLPSSSSSNSPPSASSINGGKEASNSTPKKLSTASSPPTSSSAQHSRWSEDTVTSPGVATTPGPRTSFGSLLGGMGRDSGSGSGRGSTQQRQYPACFFEDDDDEEDYDGAGCEAAPLRRKLRWQRGTGNGAAKMAKGRTQRAGRFSRRKGNLGRKCAKMVLGVFCCFRGT